MVYFDNAATSFPKPRLTQEAANSVFTRYGANPGRGGHPMAIETSQMVFRAREKLCALLHAPEPENVIFTQNCTQAINTAIKGCLQQGAHVLLSGMEHNSVFRPLEALRTKGLIQYDIAAVDIADKERTVQNFEALIRPQTRLICCIHGSNVFGTLQPVEELCALAHRYGAMFLLDAAQTAGVVPIDLQRMPADFVCLACHKGLYAPTALGALIVGCDGLLDTLIEGGSGSLSLEAAMPPFLPDRLEAGTVNTTGIAGLIGGLQFIGQRGGVQAIYREEMGVLRTVYEGLSRIKNVILYNRPELPVLSFGVCGMSGEAVAQALSARGFALRGGFHCSPLAHHSMGSIETGTARVGVGAFNTKRQAMDLVHAVERVCAAEAFHQS